MRLILHTGLNRRRIISALAGTIGFAAAVAIATPASAHTMPRIISPQVIHTRTAPTGYTVTFRYYDPTATTVQVRGEWFFSNAASTTTTTSPACSPRNGRPATSRLHIRIRDLHLTGRWPK